MNNNNNNNNNTTTPTESSLPVKLTINEHQRVSVGLSWESAATKKKICPFQNYLPSGDYEFFLYYQAQSSNVWKLIDETGYKAMSKGLRLTKYIYCPEGLQIRLKMIRATSADFAAPLTLPAGQDDINCEDLIITNYFTLHLERDKSVNRRHPPTLGNKSDNTTLKELSTRTLKTISVNPTQRFRKALHDKAGRIQFDLTGNQVSTFHYLVHSEVFEGDASKVKTLKDKSVAIQSSKAFPSQHRTLVRHGTAVELIFNGLYKTSPVTFFFPSSQNQEDCTLEEEQLTPPLLSDFSDDEDAFAMPPHGRANKMMKTEAWTSNGQSSDPKEEVDEDEPQPDQEEKNDDQVQDNYSPSETVSPNSYTSSPYPKSNEPSEMYYYNAQVKTEPSSQTSESYYSSPRVSNQPQQYQQYYYYPQSAASSYCYLRSDESQDEYHREQSKRTPCFDSEYSKQNGSYNQNYQDTKTSENPEEEQYFITESSPLRTPEDDLTLNQDYIPLYNDEFELYNRHHMNENTSCTNMPPDNNSLQEMMSVYNTKYSHPAQNYFSSAEYPDFDHRSNCNSPNNMFEDVSDDHYNTYSQPDINSEFAPASSPSPSFLFNRSRNSEGEFFPPSLTSHTA